MFYVLMHDGAAQVAAACARGSVSRRSVCFALYDGVRSSTDAAMEAKHSNKNDITKITSCVVT